MKKLNNYNLTHGSLFSGIGGFDLAAEHCGINTLFTCEIENFQNSILEKNFPNAEHFRDIKNINGANIPPVDIISFGSPCQSFSVLGNRKGLSGKSGLFFEAVRIIREMRENSGGLFPKFAIIENVKGIFSANGGKDFEVILNEFLSFSKEKNRVNIERKSNAGVLLDNGFSLAWRVLDSQFFGLAQRRKRVFIVVDFNGESAPDFLFERQTETRNFTQNYSLKLQNSTKNIESFGINATCMSVGPNCNFNVGVNLELSYTLFCSQKAVVFDGFNKILRHFMPEGLLRLQGFPTIGLTARTARIVKFIQLSLILSPFRVRFLSLMVSRKTLFNGVFLLLLIIILTSNKPPYSRVYRLYGGVSFEVIFLNPIIPYAGGKKLELPFILPLVPKNFNTYFEPFFGGGALFFALQPEFSVISDTFPELVNFYNCCKVDPFKILSFLEIIHYKYIIAADNDSVFYSKTFFQYRKSLYYDILHQFSSLSDDFQKAAYFYFISKNSNFALFRKNKIGLFNNSFKFQNNNNFFLSFKNYAPFFHNLFQNSQIFCHSYQHSLNLASSLDFVFLDPPYNNNDSNIYLNNYIDFVLLKQDFLNCSAKTLVSLPSTPQIIHLFGSFVKFSYSKKYFLRNQKSATHLIVSNF